MKSLLRTLGGTLLVLPLLLGAAQAQEQRNLAIKQAPAATDKRVALVIGNSAYQNGPLKNPVNDAADMAAKLRQLGFEVIERRDLRTSQIGRTLREFRQRLTPGAVALFYYAGHGLQIKGENYLPTVDAEIEGEEDVPNQSIAVRQIMELLEGSKTRLNLAFLDACRNNPYSRSFRSGAEGLARVSAPSGTLISFATRPGSVAADGDGRNGLYTTQLLRAIDTPNLPVELMLKQVVAGVKSASRGAQEPWMEGSIDGDFYFRSTAAAPAAAAATTTHAASQQETIDRAVQEAVRRSNEQAARERAELQAAMQKIIEQALARQQAQQHQPVGSGQPQPAASPAAAGTSVAALTPSPAAAAGLARVPGKSPQIGDEWEYLARESVFGKQRRLLWRVKAVSPGVGVLEELQVDGRPLQEWAYEGKPVLIGVPTDTAIFFGSHWDGKELAFVLPVTGTLGDCNTRIRCEVNRLRVTGKETIATAAGRYDTVRLEGWIDTIGGTRIPSTGKIEIWYAETERRVIRQRIERRPIAFGSAAVDETIELVAVRARP